MASVSAATAPDLAGPAGEGQQAARRARAPAPTRTSSTDAVCEPTTFPQTDGLDRVGRCASDNLGAVQPERSERANQQEDPRQPQQHLVGRRHRQIDGQHDRHRRARSGRSGPAAVPLYRDDQRSNVAAALPLTLSINAPTSNPECDADLKAEHSVDDVAIRRRDPPHHHIHTIADCRNRRLARPCRR